MSRDPLADVQITSQEAFKSLLSALVETSIKQDVDVRGTWEFETRGSTHNWEVEIIELAKEFDDEDVQEKKDGSGDSGPDADT